MKKAAIALAVNGGSLKAALKGAGYSDTVAQNPQKVTRSKSWKQLMDEYLPEEDVSRLHKELQNAAAIQHYDFPFPEKLTKRKKKRMEEEDGEEPDDDDYEAGGAGTPNLSDAEIRDIIEKVPGCKLIYIKDTSWARTAYFQAPDNRTRKDALDMAYKLRGRYAAEKVEITDPFERLTNSELAGKIASMKAHLLKKKAAKGKK